MLFCDYFRLFVLPLQPDQSILLRLKPFLGCWLLLGLFPDSISLLMAYAVTRLDLLRFLCARHLWPLQYNIEPYEYVFILFYVTFPFRCDPTNWLAISSLGATFCKHSHSSQFHSYAKQTSSNISRSSAMDFQEYFGLARSKIGWREGNWMG